MDKALASFAPYAYAILRIIAGLLFVCHGGQKLFGWFGGQPVPIGSLLGVAGIIEIVLGLLITIDLLTSLKTRASRRCFYIWRPRVRESGASMQRGLIEISIMKRRRSHNRNSEYLAQ